MRRDLSQGLSMLFGHAALSAVGYVAVRRIGREAAGDLAYYSTRSIRDAVFVIARGRSRVQ